MSGKSYSINHATNKGIIKDHSFRNCLKLLTLVALTFFIVTILIICWIKRSNGIEPMQTTTTKNYGVHDKVVGLGSKLINTTTPRPSFGGQQYKNVPTVSDDAHLHGPNIDDPVAGEKDRVYAATTYDPQVDLLENSSMNLSIRKMDIRLDVVRASTTQNVVKDITTSEKPEISLVFSSNTTTEKINNVLVTQPPKSEFTISIIANETTTVLKNISQTTTTQSSMPQAANVPNTLVITNETASIVVNETTTELKNLPPTTTPKLNLLPVTDVDNLTIIPVPTCPSIINVPPPLCPTPEPVCETVECRKSSSKILSLLNHESDPCDDFYAFTCSASHLNQVDLSNEDDDIYGIEFHKIDSNIEYEKKYKRFYDSCMSFDKDVELPLIKKHLETIHIENATLTDKPSKLADLLADILKFGVHGSTSKILPVIDVVMDFGPDGKFIPVITIPMGKSTILDAGDGDFYEKKCLKFTEFKSSELDNVNEIHDIFDDCMKNLTLYETVLQKSINHLSHHGTGQDASKVITTIMWDIIDEIGVITDVEKIKLADIYDPIYFSLSDLQIQQPEINWQRFFTAVFNNALFLFDKIKIMYPEYLTKIFSVYKKSSFHEIQSSLLAMIAHDFYIEYIDGSILANGNDRKRFCTKLTANSMKEVTSKILINQYGHDQITFKEKMVEKIFLESKASFSESIGSATGLSTGEKELFMNKIQNIKINDKSAEYYKDPVLLSQLYADIDMQDTLLHNTLELRKFRQKSMYSLMSKKFLENQYFWTYLMSPLENSARTFIELNTIAVPFRLLTKTIPNANKMKQNYEIYSKLSYQISYELASFFNPTNIRKFWTTQNEVYKNFAATNLIDPYITQISNPYGLELNKDSIKYTLNSRFNDDAAILNAFKTYRERSSPKIDLPLPWLNLTIPQLFYVTFAQQFCYINPNRVKTSIDIVQSDKLQPYFRLNSLIMNSNNFPDVYHCNRGTNMNPSLKIEQFPHLDAGTFEDITDNAT